MNIPEKYKGRYFYHFTHVDNMKSIVEQNGLLSTNLKHKMNISHHNVAIGSIQERRSKMRVTAGPGGVVHDYVPFYFATTNKMLLSLLNRKIVDQPYIVFMAISIEKLLDKNVVFTNASANTSKPPNFYDDPSDLDQLNWKFIDSISWKEESRSDQEKHLRMAEVLVYEKVPLDWIDTYIVFDQIGRNRIEDCYQHNNHQRPRIENVWFNGRKLFFTKFFVKNRSDETLVTGPIQLYEKYQKVVEDIFEERRKKFKTRYKFKDIDDALGKLDNNFCSIKELSDIFELKTTNKIHKETVSDHTLSVVKNVENSLCYLFLNDRQKSIVKFAAYLHDIGKGPKEKWENEKQRVYDDHPSDSLSMLVRIISDDFKIIRYEDYRLLCLLVAYHDLLGDIIGEKKRSKWEFDKLNLTDEELCMLAALSEADAKAIGIELSLIEG